MTQPVRFQSLAAGPSASFEQPFEMLEACHERVHRMLALLARLREHLCTHGADEQARQAARDVMRYFDQAAPQHHMDEELHVFPRLLAQGDAKVAATVRQLQQDHVQMETGWARARQVLTAVEQGALQRPCAEDDAALDAFADLYGGHIRAEEGIAYPAAASLMDDEALAAMGQEMMRRRGVR
jgi:hemerythrin-like domain-containing protein